MRYNYCSLTIDSRVRGRDLTTTWSKQPWEDKEAFRISDLGAGVKIE
jgi:hypothetical protein